MNKLFSKLLSSGVDRSMKMFDRLDSMLDDFDGDDFMGSMLQTRDRLIKHGNRLLGTMNEFAKRVQDTVTAFTYTIPFDPEVDTLSYSVEDGMLKVRTESKTDTTTSVKTTTTTIPETCDASRIKHTVNKDKKTATIIIPKNNPELEKLSDDMKKNFDSIQQKVKGAIKIVKDSVADATKPEVSAAFINPSDVPEAKAEPKAEEVQTKFKSVKKSTAKKRKPAAKATTTKKGNVKVEVKK